MLYSFMNFYSSNHIAHKHAYLYTLQHSFERYELKLFLVKPIQQVNEKQYTRSSGIFNHQYLGLFGKDIKIHLHSLAFLDTDEYILIVCC